MSSDASHTAPASLRGSSLPVVRVASLVLGTVLALYAWLDVVVPPAMSFSAAAIVALLWCAWLDRRASARPS